MFNLSAFLSYAIIMTFTPGPNNITSMASASRKGFQKTLPYMLGIFSGFVIIMCLASFFNLILSAYLPNLMPLMKIVGMVFLIYLALKIMGIDFLKKQHHSSHKAETIFTYRTGLMMQFVNYKVIIYGITILSGFVMPVYSNPIVLFGFALLLAGFSFSSVCSWALFGSLFNQFLKKYEKITNLVMALLLVYSALSLGGIIH